MGEGGRVYYQEGNAIFPGRMYLLDQFMLSVALKKSYLMPALRSQWLKAFADGVEGIDTIDLRFTAT
jgi:hypothetical protein